MLEPERMQCALKGVGEMQSECDHRDEVDRSTHRLLESRAHERCETRAFLSGHLPDAEVIVVDPMLATGHSASAAITQLKAAGANRIRFICCVSCPEGLAQVREAHPDVPVFTAAVDDGLNERAYIVPGLGDAGDRYFGTY